MNGLSSSNTSSGGTFTWFVPLWFISQGSTQRKRALLHLFTHRY
jgi:hypothetical protein